MDVGEIFVKVFNIGHSIYAAERVRKRANQRSSELRELDGKVATVLSKTAPEIENTGNTTQQAGKTAPATSEGLVEAKDQSPPETADELSLKRATATATGCLPCSIGHLGTCTGLLNEGMRFARTDGVGSGEVIDRVNMCLDEIAALIRVDLRPENIVNLPAEEKELAEEVLVKSRNISHRLEEIGSVAELQSLAAEVQELRQRIGREWFQRKIAALKARRKQEA